MNGIYKIVAVLFMGVGLGFLSSTLAIRSVYAHGTMEDPISRVYQCYREGPENPQSAACQAAVIAGGTQEFYDWNGVNRLAGDQHRQLIADGQLCSAGKETHRGLDLARNDWRAQSIAPDQNGNYEFVFYATAPHSTQYFDFYVTKDGYDPTQPLKWSDLEATPFCHITSVTLENGHYRMTCPLPQGKSGRHILYNIWQRDDSPEAFYSCLDVEIGGNSAPTVTVSPPASTPISTATPTPATGVGCQVNYSVTSDWGSGFEAGVVITNQNNTPTNNWILTWSFPGNQTITSLWNGKVNQTGSGVIVNNESWNGVIGANGGAVSIGFGATYQGTNPTPPSFLLNGAVCATPGATPTTTPVTPTPTPTSDGATPTPTPTSTGAPGGGKTVVTYFTQWGVYERNYHVKNIVTSGAAPKITHINYAFGNIVNGACVMTTQAGVMDAYADYQKSYTAAESVDGRADVWDQPLRGNFNQLKKLKQMYPQIKLLISLGGWTWSGGFHAAAMTPHSRQQVVQSCIDLYIRGNLPVADNAGGPGAAAGLFDGIDIDWEYPGDPGNGNPYGPEDTHNFTLLLQEFRTQLNAIDPNLLLTVATGAGVDKYSLLELDQIHPLLNHINVMSYDFHGAWEPLSGFNAPLYASPGAPYNHPASTYAVDSSVQGYRNAGVPANKIILGIPFYGRGWTGVGQTNHGLWQSATGAAPGAWEAGIEDYKVIKNLSYPVYRDEAAGAVWKFNGSVFWSYDDPQTIAAKLAYMNQHNLGGVMVWSLDGDTTDGELMSAIGNGVAAVPPNPPTGLTNLVYVPLMSR